MLSNLLLWLLKVKCFSYATPSVEILAPEIGGREVLTSQRVCRLPWDVRAPQKDAPWEQPTEP